LRLSIKSMALIFPALLVPLSALAESWSDGGYDALYRPDTFYADHYGCSADTIGEHTGAMIISEEQIEGYFINCTLSQPRSLAAPNSTQYSAICTSRKGEIAEELTLQRTDRGVDITRNGYTTEYVMCDLANDEAERWVSREEAEIEDWKLYYIESFVRMETYNDPDNWVSFGCRWNWKEGGIYVQIDGAIATGPEVIFDIDGKQYPMTTEGAIFGKINTGCEDCKDKYRELWQAVTLGNNLTVIPSEGRSAEFSLKGAHAVMGDIPCIPIEDPAAMPH